MPPCDAVNPARGRMISLGRELDIWNTRTCEPSLPDSSSCCRHHTPAERLRVLGTDTDAYGRHHCGIHICVVHGLEPERRYRVQPAG